MLAERLGSGPSLLPVASVERAECLGLCMEIAAQQGFSWNARLWMLAALMGTDPAAAATPLERNMLRQYGMSAAAAAAAPARVADIVQNLAQQLRAQRGRGREYLVGSQLTALDVYWACFSQMIAPLPPDVNPVPDYVRSLYGAPPPQVAAALDPLLLEHRDRIFERHIGLPLDY
jgi:glutathione S-transferase